MNSRDKVVALVLLCCGGCAGARSDEPIAAPTHTTSASAAPENPTTRFAEAPAPRESAAALANAPPLSDGQIAGTASRIDLLELDAGKLALEAARSTAVHEYARHILTAHAAIEASLVALTKARGISPEQSDLCAKLAADGAEQRQALMGQSGFDFDRAYVTLEVRNQEAALDLLDHTLLPVIYDPQLRAVLEDEREKIEQDLKTARGLLSSLPAP